MVEVQDAKAEANLVPPVGAWQRKWIQTWKRSKRRVQEARCGFPQPHPPAQDALQHWDQPWRHGYHAKRALLLLPPPPQKKMPHPFRAFHEHGSAKATPKKIARNIVSCCWMRQSCTPTCHRDKISGIKGPLLLQVNRHGTRLHLG